jgi:hypothetical protein|tara:strand:- start:1027 stop:1137 length:111 start_codon:yes stop_codon:yes gene_type:complete
MNFYLSEAKILDVLVQLLLKDGCGMNPMMRRFMGGG